MRIARLQDEIGVLNRLWQHQQPQSAGSYGGLTRAFAYPAELTKAHDYCDLLYKTANNLDNDVDTRESESEQNCM